MIDVMRRRVVRRAASIAGNLLNQGYWWSPRFVSPDSSLLYGQGLANGMDGVLGSTGGSDTNDPTLLKYEGVSYLYCPGLSGNYSGVYSAAYEITADFDLRVHARLNTSVSTQTLLSKYNPTGNLRSWLFRVSNAGVLLFVLSNNGTDTATYIASTGLGAAAFNVDRWFRVVREKTSGDVTFYTSIDGINWIQVGNVLAGGIMIGLDVLLSAEAIKTGLYQTASEPMEGRIYRYQIYRSVNGSALVLDSDFSLRDRYDATRTSLTPVVGATALTLTRNTIGKKLAVVERPTLLFGTDDYLEIADHASLDVGTGQEFTLIFAGRLFDPGSSITETLIAKKVNATSGAGYILYRNRTSLIGRINDGVNDTFGSGAVSPSGFFGPTWMRRSGGIIRTVGSSGGQVADTTLDLTNAEVLRIGRLSGAGAQYGDLEFYGLAIIKRNLTDAEILSVWNRLIGT